MKLGKTLILAAAVLCALPLAAQDVLYDNGKDPGNIFGWPVSGGHTVWNSFQITVDSTVTGLDVSLYDVNEHNIPLTLDWRILDAPGGNVLAYGTQTPLTRVDG